MKKTFFLFLSLTSFLVYCVKTPLLKHGQEFPQPLPALDFSDLADGVLARVLGDVKFRILENFPQLLSSTRSAYKALRDVNQKSIILKNEETLSPEPPLALLLQCFFCELYCYRLERNCFEFYLFKVLAASCFSRLYFLYFSTIKEDIFVRCSKLMENFQVAYDRLGFPIEGISPLNFRSTFLRFCYQCCFILREVWQISCPERGISFHSCSAEYIHQSLIDHQEYYFRSTGGRQYLLRHCTIPIIACSISKVEKSELEGLEANLNSMFGLEMEPGLLEEKFAELEKICPWPAESELDEPQLVSMDDCKTPCGKQSLDLKGRSWLPLFGLRGWFRPAA